MFYIQCESCMENNTLHGAYNNQDEIEITIAGEQLVKIKCTTCGNSITVIDGKL